MCHHLNRQVLTFSVSCVCVFEVGMWNKPWCSTHTYLYPSVLLCSMTRNFLNPPFIPASSEGLRWAHVQKVLPSSPQHPILQPFSNTTTIKHLKLHLRDGEILFLKTKGWLLLPLIQAGKERIYLLCFRHLLVAVLAHLTFASGGYCDRVDQWIALKFPCFGLFLLYYYFFSWDVARKG